jgi:hypothetical protein
MKRVFLFLFISLFVPSIHISAQTISMPADSVSILLCRTWEMSYTIMGGQRIPMSPQSPTIVHDYLPDHTFVIYNNPDSIAAKGTWSYDPTKKIIILMVKDKHDIIVSLDRTEYVQKVETAKGTPEIKIVYKPLSAPRQ